MVYLSRIGIKKLKSKTCLLRVDFNVETAGDALRLEAPLPTIKYLLRAGCRVLMISHRGRPKGVEQKSSLRVFVPFLKRALKQEVRFLGDIPAVLPASGRVFLLENLRFWPGEEKNDLNFARKLARLGDFYVNDAFAVCHRNNASVTRLPKLLPAYAGLLLENEIAALTAAAKRPKKPLVLIVGGAKIEDKAVVIKNILPKAQRILLGSSILNAKDSRFTIHDSRKVLKPVDWIGENGKAYDIGPLTIGAYAKEIKKARTIIWNGPVGWFEKRGYERGSVAVARAIADSGAFSVVGGGETTALFISAIPNYQFLISKKKLFLSTGGGAMLEFLAGKELPGIKALR